MDFPRCVAPAWPIDHLHMQVDVQIYPQYLLQYSTLTREYSTLTKYRPLFIWKSMFLPTHVCLCTQLNWRYLLSYSGASTIIFRLIDENVIRSVLPLNPFQSRKLTKVPQIIYSRVLHVPPSDALRAPCLLYIWCRKE